LLHRRDLEWSRQPDRGIQREEFLLTAVAADIRRECMLSFTVAW